jgi:hypothetical protein
MQSFRSCTAREIPVQVEWAHAQCTDWARDHSCLGNPSFRAHALETEHRQTLTEYCLSATVKVIIMVTISGISMSFGEQIKVTVFFLFKHLQHKRNAITPSRTDYNCIYWRVALFLRNFGLYFVVHLISPEPSFFYNFNPFCEGATLCLITHCDVKKSREVEA